MKNWKKQMLCVVSLFVMLALSACGERLTASDVYLNAIEEMGKIESVEIERYQQMNVGQQSFSGSAKGIFLYDPFRAYIETTMGLIDLHEGIVTEMVINEEGWFLQADDQTNQWEVRDRELFIDPIFQEPVTPLLFYNDYNHEFLMKENEDGIYEVSFRGSDNNYAPLIKKQLMQMGISELENGQQDSGNIDVERIEMTVWVNPDTFLVSQFESRMRFTMEIAGEIHPVTQSLRLTFDSFNEIDQEDIPDTVGH